MQDEKNKINLRIFNFEFICSLIDIFNENKGILTTNNIQQAVDRAGKKYDKGKGFFDSSILMHEVIAKINKRTND